MPSKKTQKYIHSFSANFFGVTGYIASNFVWLLVLTCVTLVSSPSESIAAFSEQAQEPLAIVIPGTTIKISQQASSPLLSFLLGVVAFILFWAFSYVASRVLSRVVRRVVGIFHKKVTIQNLIKIKYFIHTIGLVILVLLLVLLPGFIWLKNTIAVLALFSGTIGMVAIWLQYQLSKRHSVPVARIL